MRSGKSSLSNINGTGISSVEALPLTEMCGTVTGGPVQFVVGLC